MRGELAKLGFWQTLVVGVQELEANSNFANAVGEVGSVGEVGLQLMNDLG